MFLDFQFELRLAGEPGLTGQAIFYILTLLWFVFMWLHGMTEDGQTSGGYSATLGNICYSCHFYDNLF